jgi:hypothetical protein
VPDTRPADSDRTWPPCPAIGAHDSSLTERRRPSSAAPMSSTTEERTNARSIDRGVSRPELSKALVRFIADHGSAARILAEHTPTSDGRCPSCPAGASSSGRVKSPCTLYLAAQAAAELGGSPRHD